jgi:hypothetical protein
MEHFRGCVEGNRYLFARHQRVRGNW